MEGQQAVSESPVLKLRRQTGITQRELATAAGVHQSIVAGLEAGVIAIDEDAEIKGKVDELFTKLSEWSGLDKEELLQQQIEFNRTVARDVGEKFAEKMRQYVEERLREGTYENYFGPEPLNEETLEIIWDCLDDPDESPLKILREYAQISQRQLALAAGVSQTVVARIEAGELGFLGVGAAEKLLRFLVDTLASRGEDETIKQKLADYIRDAQEVFHERFPERAKAKVAEAMARLRKDGKADGAAPA